MLGESGRGSRHGPGTYPTCIGDVYIRPAFDDNAYRMPLLCFVSARKALHLHQTQHCVRCMSSDFRFGSKIQSTPPKLLTVLFLFSAISQVINYWLWLSPENILGNSGFQGICRVWECKIPDVQFTDRKWFWELFKVILYRLWPANKHLGDAAGADCNQPSLHVPLRGGALPVKTQGKRYNPPPFLGEEGVSVYFEAPRAGF